MAGMTEPRIFGDPYETPDGTTVLPVHRPVGVFTVHEGRARWEPAVDTTRITLLGIGVGLVAATLAGIAMVHRPPWPDVRLRG